MKVARAMKSLLARTRTSLTYLGIAILVAAAAMVLNTPRSMSAVWYGPYLSAAENLTWGGHFLMNLDEVVAFREMSDEQRNEYRFTAVTDLREYIGNQLGYAYFIYAAKKTFFWLPDVRALEAFQILLHTLLSLLVIALLDGWRRRLLFLMLYSLNPVVLYYVSFPFYYFLQAIPSFGLLFLLLTRDRWALPERNLLHGVFVVLCIALAFVLLARSTTIAAVAAFFVLAALWLPDRRTFLLGLAVFAALVSTAYSPSQKPFWHTAYIGVGAYPNSHMTGLSDVNGYALFEEKTGSPLNASLGGNLYDESVMAQYGEIARDGYLSILRSDWPSLMGNAVLNALQGFTIGYLVGKPYWVHLVMAATGFAVLAFLLVSRQFLLVALTVLTTLPFTLYFPPIPAYMYGAYLLLVAGALGALQTIGVLGIRGPHQKPHRD
jgi:hypothetical protein